MAITRETPASRRSSMAWAMKGFQLRMPTTTGTAGPSRTRSASAWSIVSAVSGDSPPIAS